MTALNDLITLEQQVRAFGFDWPHPEMILDQIVSETQEVRAALAHHESLQRIQEEAGDVLHAAISLCVFLKLDLDQTLRITTQKFQARMAAVYALARHKGLSDLHSLSLEAKLELWNQAKQTLL